MSTKLTLTAILGASLLGLGGYLAYLLVRSDEDDEDADDAEFPAAAPNFRTVEIPVPRGAVGPLIGRKGANIRAIERRCDARLHARDAAPGSRDGERVVVVRGSEAACEAAAALVREFVAACPAVECREVAVPSRCVGKVIGRCGERIQEIASLSGAKMNFADDDRQAAARRLLIRGTAEQVALAASYVDDVIARVDRAQAEMESSLARREPRAPPAKRGGGGGAGDAPNAAPDGPRAERISPTPGQPDSQFDVYISAMIDPSHFWVQIVGPKATELDQLVEDMTDYYAKEDNREIHVLDSLQTGDLVAALFKYDKKWYRAEVLSISAAGDEAELYYVDYGDTDTVSVSDVYELRTDFLQLHFQAIECYLGGGVEPAGGRWTVEAVDRFEEWTHVAQWKKLAARVDGYAVREKVRARQRDGSPVPGVELFGVAAGGAGLSVGEELVRHGYAVFRRDERPPSSSASGASSRAPSTGDVSVESAATG